MHAMNDPAIAGAVLWGLRIIRRGLSRRSSLDLVPGAPPWVGYSRPTQRVAFLAFLTGNAARAGLPTRKQPRNSDIGRKYARAKGFMLAGSTAAQQCF